MFRLWVVVSIAWLGLTATMMRPDQSFSTYWTFRTLPTAEEALSAAIETAEPLPTDLEPSIGTTTSYRREELIAEAHRRGLLPENAQGGKMPDGWSVILPDGTTKALMSLADAQRHRSHAIGELKDFAGVALIPLVFLLVFGFALAWVFRGFKRDPG